MQGGQRGQALRLQQALQQMEVGVGHAHAGSVVQACATNSSALPRLVWRSLLAHELQRYNVSAVALPPWRARFI
ncbi:ABC-type Fe3+-siderophore transport system, permease component [Serpentinimonas raichei]|uniref:ABC-type Fe3+-siderophore transport system, permease component n=1 Tax=Serpentinimonas raichei TaxID=1458425 RepID=A0A060NNR2_9BURK|nr:ABC-type Fe3+-siderophore transport system, permease component [Serpentinimonas raichei]